MAGRERKMVRQALFSGGKSPFSVVRLLLPVFMKRWDPDS
jgi:hypothetical protein